MPRGGQRPGAGRPIGAVSRVSATARAAAANTGELPHEFLLRIARGDEIDGQKSSLKDRIDAAKAAAPFFAPRHASQEVKVSTLSQFSSEEECKREIIEGLRDVSADGSLDDMFLELGFRPVRKRQPENSGPT